ncbi:MAG TPA: ABC transporter permease, partial [Anaerolineales bacterium]|nr:ABC transporter permease [Anaerolineales bacterium]
MAEITSPAIQEQSMSRLILRRFFKHKLAAIAVSVLALLVIVSVFAGFSPYNPTDQAPTNSLKAPDSTHWFGTDELGRDVFSRILYGGRVSLAVGLVSTFLSILLGVVVGALSGYFGGWLDSALMRITDAFLTFPTIFVLILLGAFLREQQLFILQNSIVVVIIIIAALSWMWPARLV